MKTKADDTCKYGAQRTQKWLVLRLTFLSLLIYQWSVLISQLRHRDGFFFFNPSPFVTYQKEMILNDVTITHLMTIL